MSLIEVRVEIPGAAYPVWIGPGALDRLAELVPRPERAEVCALVSDGNVAALHADRARAGLGGWGLRVEEMTLEPGEASKTPATVVAVWRWLAASGAHRSDVLVALGGGVVGDLAGFAAASYHRGMRFVQAPTTLLGQVDASIGGKTGVDLPEGKNLVGAFYQPLAVVADTAVLATLPDAELATGMAEVIKHGLIADGELLERAVVARDEIVARDLEELAALIAAAARVKARVVAADEHEAGERAHLNYGHTLAHALETLAGYRGTSHGEAVAVGMMFAAALAGRLGYPDRSAEHRRALEAYDLPTGGAGYPYDQVAQVWVRDKKYEAGMRFVVLEELGRPTIVRDVPEHVLRDAYEVVR